MNSAEPEHPAAPGRAQLRGVRLAVTAVVVACVVWAASATRASVDVVLDDVTRALWTMPVLIALHLVQLLLSGISWRTICAARTMPGLGTFFRLRLIRESIDSLLPVAQIDGEVVGARLLAAPGMTTAVAGASVVVDLTMELAAQVLFLLIGLAALGLLRGQTSWLVWLEVAGAMSGELMEEADWANIGPTEAIWKKTH